jgi:hypothetical protein
MITFETDTKPDKYECKKVNTPSGRILLPCRLFACR